jgi:ketosteroid isomerase-like protein
MALLFTTACSKSDQDQAEIVTLITTRSAALNSKDLAKYISVVSLEYNDKGKDFSRLKADLEKNFKNLEQLSYEADQPAIIINGNQAAATGSYRMKVRVRGKELALNGSEHLRFRKEPGGWKIIAGI